ncbi:MAG: extracellular solute-binding protein [Patescibacteria group bacterium]
MTKVLLKKISIFSLLLSLIILPGLRCKLFPSKEAIRRIQPVVLNWWRVTDGPDSVSEIINRFQQQYSHIAINYQQFRPEEYELALLEAWAEDRGPDIFSIPVTWLGKYKTKILPMPAKMTIGKQILTGKIKKEPRVIIEEKGGLSLRDLRNNFVDTVVNDIYQENQILGLPLYLDTLALYFNRDLLNQAKIVEPPKTWDEFINDVNLLNIFDRQGNLIQSAVALGTSNNIENAVDILSTLMLQNGTQMTSDGSATFNLPSRDDPSYFPGEEALRFYTDFADPAKEIYSWNKNMPSALNAFTQNKTAFYIGYASDLAKIRDLNPKLNFDLTKLPQIKGSLKEANIANYWVETVAKKTKYPNEAWIFLMFAAENQNVKTYLDRTKRPTANRALIQSQLENIDLAPFASQVLTAQSWYRGRNWPSAEKALREMIDDVVEGRRTIKEAINYYVQIVNQTY